MRNREAATVTKDDLLKYFTGGRWKTIKDMDDELEFTWSHLEVNIKPIGTQFFYHVEATDDPSDYDEGTTDDPVGAIAKFIGGGIPEGEFFEKMASSPRGIAYTLRDFARRVGARTIGPKALVKVLRRLQVFPRIGAIRIAVSLVAKMAEGRFEEDEIDVLLKDMESKGWRVTRSESPKSGLPTVELDIDYFKATIEVESIPYEIQYIYEGRRDLAVEQVTDDPVREFQTWYRSDEFKEAEEDRKEAVESAKSKEFEEGKTILAPPSQDGEPPPSTVQEKLVPSKILNEETVPSPA